jgi:hypothetical protein
MLDVWYLGHKCVLTIVAGWAAGLVTGFAKQ